MKIFNLLLPGQPIPKARARKGMHGFYNSQAIEMRKAQLEIRAHLPEKFQLIPIGIPVTVNMIFFFSPAKSQLTKNFIELIKNEDCPFLKKGDIDNLEKFVLDVMSGIIFHDDNQVYASSLYKFYTPDNPRTEIEVVY